MDTKRVFCLSFEGMAVDPLQQNSYLILSVEAIWPHCKKKAGHFNELGPGPFDFGGSKLTFFLLENYRIFCSYLL